VGCHEISLSFCPQCGGNLFLKKLKENEPERSVCSLCGAVIYNDPKVVACCMIERDGRIVLLKRDLEPQRSRWVLPGGYVDRGETVKDAAVREAKEECGLVVAPRELLGVYSYPGNIHVVIVYVSSPTEGDLTPRDETQEAGWFSEEEIPWQDLAFDSTSDALKDYFNSECGFLQKPSKKGLLK
jgi:ADP-ribose pyrophosphatase YjhB (NUDIX family)